ncbi:helix-turn-helix transcriptional regulator [uncultured Clostridium sp.]|uniref:helix-turn-helix domain-containing protein n=1 Tax=uncultured Clostridium sp. TaxID=59620 RepID=UPI0028E29B33|nr:helix-turn-helix transcriptional regulator [uncultured Clostridium sp.]
MFYTRLENYRNSLNLNKRELADKLEVSESYYNMIENGKRNPSKTFMIKLVNFSNKPEEYWIYGIDENNYLNSRDDLKSTFEAVKLLIKSNALKEESDVESKLFKSIDFDSLDLVDQLILTALKTDIEYLITKTKK